MQGKWIKSPTLPIKIRRSLDEFVILNMGTYKPYMFHSEVKKYYPASRQQVRRPAPVQAPKEKRKRISLPSITPRSYTGRYRYEYYPAAFVYYDTIRGVYFYRLNGQWIESPKLPEEINPYKGSPVYLDLDTDRPYLFHSEVIKKYPHPGYDTNVQEIIRIKRIYRK
jgi:hypothetical protein